MIQKYFRFTKRRVLTFSILTVLILILQIILTGSLVSRQKVITEAGNSESAVIGILDKTELVRQKFRFDRKVILKEFALSFGSFERKEVGDTLHIQMLDGDSSIVYETDIPVDKLTPNATYRVPMEYTVTIPKGVTCCIKLSCSSKEREYDTIPTLNTTNRTDPNTYMSTLKMQTRKKCLNISYTYYYRQIFPLAAIIIEFVLLFFLCFERITEYSALLRRREKKRERKRRNAEQLEELAKEKRTHSKSGAAKVRYSRSNTMDAKREKRLRKQQHKKNREQLRKASDAFSLKAFIKHCLAEPKYARRIRIAAIILNPLFVMFCVEQMNDNLLNMGPNVWIFTWILLLALQYILYALIGNMSAAIIALNAVMFPVGIANLILMNVRGTPLLPSDLLALGTAAEVAGTYTISLTPAQFVMLPAFILWCFLICRMNQKKGKTELRKRLAKRLTPIVLSGVTVGILYGTPLLENVKITDNVWNKVASCRTNGFYMNFFINIRYLTVSKPSGYSEAKLEEILEEYKKEKTENATAAPASGKFTTNADYTHNTALNGKKPNIILIMNESLADYDLVGKTNYNKDPLSFLHSMKKNTIYGKDYVSIYGAGTSNSEFEAMTGNTMKFFPSGSNVYQQFMHDKTFSLAYYLKSLGYSTMAVHPSSGANWNRIKTYESMHFDKFITIDDFKNPEYIRYISDKESYKKVIELYENKKEGTPFFAFDMTIQNHGGYLTNTKWDDPIYVKGSYYEETKEFLSATKVSDDAFRYLISYFEKQEEPTIICMFGDHQPSIEVAFYEELLKKKQNDWELTDIQKRYVTPFVIWANYDIQEGRDAVISNNYLENMLLKQAGLELPLYNQYIEKVSKEIPAMNVNGYMDSKGGWHAYDSDETDTVKELLQNYEYLQYGYYSETDKDNMQKLFEVE